MDDQQKILLLELQIAEMDRLLREAIPFVETCNKYSPGVWEINASGRWLKKAKQLYDQDTNR